MKIKVLGCSGAEFPGHNPSSFLLGDRILFDAGSLTNILDAKNQLKVEHIFITHAHLDHVTGIPYLAENIAFLNMRRRVNIISIPYVMKIIKRHLLNGSVWPDFTTIPDAHHGILRLIELKVGTSMKINDYTITPYKVNHTVPAVGYLVEDKRKRRFFYTGDTGPSVDTWEKIGDKKLQFLIIEVSFPNRMEGVAIKTGHLTPLLIKKELLKMKYSPERIYITHLKPQFLKTVKTELKKLGIKNLRLLRDGETIEV
jgi:ribonuclease BN (tRNA processing enzyme)